MSVQQRTPEGPKASRGYRELGGSYNTTEGSTIAPTGEEDFPYQRRSEDLTSKHSYESHVIESVARMLILDSDRGRNSFSFSSHESAYNLLKEGVGIFTDRRLMQYEARLYASSVVSLIQQSDDCIEFPHRQMQTQYMRMDNTERVAFLAIGCLLLELHKKEEAAKVFWELSKVTGNFWGYRAAKNCSLEWRFDQSAKLLERPNEKEIKDANDELRRYLYNSKLIKELGYSKARIYGSQYIRETIEIGKKVAAHLGLKEATAEELYCTEDEVLRYLREDTVPLPPGVLPIIFLMEGDSNLDWTVFTKLLPIVIHVNPKGNRDAKELNKICNVPYISESEVLEEQITRSLEKLIIFRRRFNNLRGGENGFFQPDIVLNNSSIFSHFKGLRRELTTLSVGAGYLDSGKVSIGKGYERAEQKSSELALIEIVKELRSKRVSLGSLRALLEFEPQLHSNYVRRINAENTNGESVTSASLVPATKHWRLKKSYFEEFGFKHFRILYDVELPGSIEVVKFLVEDFCFWGGLPVTFEEIREDSSPSNFEDLTFILSEDGAEISMQLNPHFYDESIVITSTKNFLTDTPQKNRWELSEMNLESFFEFLNAKFQQLRKKYKFISDEPVAFSDKLENYRLSKLKADSRSETPTSPVIQDDAL